MPKTTSTYYAVANLGRTKKAATVRASMLIIRKHIGTRRAVLGLVEMDEGDKTKPTDHQLLGKVFTRLRRWRKTWMPKREPILSHKIRPRRTLGRSIHAANGVPHLSPSRTWQESVYPTADGLVHVICGHYNIAKVHKTANKERARELADGYERQQLAEQSLVTHALAQPGVAGVVILADRNDRAYKHLHPREVTVAHHGLDYITAIPAKGHKVTHSKADVVGLTIEPFHKMLGATISFPKA